MSVNCGQTAGWIKMPLGTVAGLLCQGDIVLWGPNSTPHPQRGTTPNFRPMSVEGWWRWALLSPNGVAPSRMVGVKRLSWWWSVVAKRLDIKMPLGTEVGIGLGPGHIVFDRDPARSSPSKRKGAQQPPPHFPLTKRSSISATAELLSLFDTQCGLSSHIGYCLFFSAEILHCESKKQGTTIYCP